jgi:hypothetical protein
MPMAPTTVGSTPYRPLTAPRTGAGWPAHRSPLRHAAHAAGRRRSGTTRALESCSRLGASRPFPQTTRESAPVTTLFAPWQERSRARGARCSLCLDTARDAAAALSIQSILRYRRQCSYRLPVFLSPGCSRGGATCPPPLLLPRCESDQSSSITSASRPEQASPASQRRPLLIARSVTLVRSDLFALGGLRRGCCTTPACRLRRRTDSVGA